MLAPNWLGDAVMATPFCSALRARLPWATVSLLCRSYVADVFRGHPAVDRLVACERSGGVWRRISAVRGARPKGGFDVCFTMPPSFAAALVAFCSGARRRVGYDLECRGLLLNEPLPGSQYRSGHLSEAYLRLLERITAVPETVTPLPVVAPPERWQEVVERRVATNDYFVLAPGATYGSSKVWPIERFGALARRLTENTGWPCVVVGAAGEWNQAQRILDVARSAGMNLASECSLGELIAILRGSRVTIGNDSGPAHISAALGRPTIVLFGPTSPRWTAPRGLAVRIVRAEVSCSPCFEKECPRGTPECLLSVSVDEVYDAVSRSIEEDMGGKK